MVCLQSLAAGILALATIEFRIAGFQGGFLLLKMALKLTSVYIFDYVRKVFCLRNIYSSPVMPFQSL